MAMERYNVFISEIVVEEASFGDTEAAKRRLEELKDFPHLELSDKIEEITQLYMNTNHFVLILQSFVHQKS